MELQRKQNQIEGEQKYYLPEPIIHKILCVLETKDAGKTRFLSKTWQRALASFPCIHLDESDFTAKSIEHPNNYPLKKEEIRKENAFMTYIDNTLQSRLEHTSSLEVEEFTLKLTRFLSKTWQRALASFPCIHLDESNFNAKSIEHPNNYPLKKEEIRKKKNAFMTYIDNTLQSRLEHTSSLEVEEFTLKLTYHDKEFVLPRVVK